MKVGVNHETCEGYGMCAALAPDVFQIQGDGSVRVIHDEPVDAVVPDGVEDAIDACPTQSVFTSE